MERDYTIKKAYCAKVKGGRVSHKWSSTKRELQTWWQNEANPFRGMPYDRIEVAAMCDSLAPEVRMNNEYAKLFASVDHFYEFYCETYYVLFYVCDKEQDTLYIIGAVQPHQIFQQLNGGTQPFTAELAVDAVRLGLAFPIQEINYRSFNLGFVTKCRRTLYRVTEQDDDTWVTLYSPDCKEMRDALLLVPFGKELDAMVRWRINLIYLIYDNLHSYSDTLWDDIYMRIHTYVNAETNVALTSQEGRRVDNISFHMCMYLAAVDSGDFASTMKRAEWAFMRYKIEFLYPRESDMVFLLERNSFPVDYRHVSSLETPETPQRVALWRKMAPSRQKPRLRFRCHFSEFTTRSPDRPAVPVLQYPTALGHSSALPVSRGYIAFVYTHLSDYLSEYAWRLIDGFVHTQEMQRVSKCYTECMKETQGDREPSSRQVQAKYAQQPLFVRQCSGVTKALNDDVIPRLMTILNAKAQNVSNSTLSESISLAFKSTSTTESLLRRSVNLQFDRDGNAGDVSDQECDGDGDGDGEEGEGEDGSNTSASDSSSTEAAKLFPPCIREIIRGACQNGRHLKYNDRQLFIFFLAECKKPMDYSSGAVRCEEPLFTDTQILGFYKMLCDHNTSKTGSAKYTLEEFAKKNNYGREAVSLLKAHHGKQQVKRVKTASGQEQQYVSGMSFGCAKAINSGLCPFKEYEERDLRYMLQDQHDVQDIEELDAFVVTRGRRTTEQCMATCTQCLVRNRPHLKREKLVKHPNMYTRAAIWHSQTSS